MFYHQPGKFCIVVLKRKFWYNKQHVREKRNLFSNKESVVFRDFGGNDYRVRPFTVEV